METVFVNSIGTIKWWEVLIKLDRKTGEVLGYVESTGTHGMDVMTTGEPLSASPGAGKVPLWYRGKGNLKF